jgi:hypothetical protein
LISDNPEFRLRSFLFRGEHELQTPRQTDYSNNSWIFRQAVREPRM